MAVWRDLTGEGGYAPAATLRDVHERSIYSIDWSRDGLIATGGGDDAICVLRVLMEGTSLVGLERVGLERGAHAGDVNAVAWRPGSGGDGLLASCGDDGALKLWQACAAEEL